MRIAFPGRQSHRRLAGGRLLPAAPRTSAARRRAIQPRARRRYRERSARAHETHGLRARRRSFRVGRRQRCRAGAWDDSAPGSGWRWNERLSRLRGDYAELLGVDGGPRAGCGVRGAHNPRCAGLCVGGTCRRGRRLWSRAWRSGAQAAGLLDAADPPRRRRGAWRRAGTVHHRLGYHFTEAGGAVGGRVRRAVIEDIAGGGMAAPDEGG